MKTVESVTEGHPDKVCDQISDAFVDEYLKFDPNSRVAVETFGAHGIVMVGGEVTSRLENLDAENLVRRIYKDIGYEDDLEVLVNIQKQSPDISMGVDTGGAGDQGIMYGYATNETPEYLPRAVAYVQALAQRLAFLRKNHPDCSWIMPDGKTQVTMDGERVTTVVVSTQHREDISEEEIRQNLISKLIEPVIGDLSSVEILTNPTGRFVIGGFKGDSGLTGRKLMVDTYGGLLPHGGGAFSGKDSTKVDRSAAYMARFAAKNMVANGLADSCFVSVAYAIGRAEPVMLRAISKDGKDLTEVVKRNFDFRPQAIIERLGLRRPIFRATAAYGHFGRPGFPWEEIAPLF